MVRSRRFRAKRGAPCRNWQVSMIRTRAMIMAAGLGTRMRPADRRPAQAAGEVARQAADRSCHRPAGGGGRDAGRRQSALQGRDAEGASGQAPRHRDPLFRRRPTRCSAPAAAWSRRCRISKASRSSCSIRIRSGSKAIGRALDRMKRALESGRDGRAAAAGVDGDRHGL